MKARPNLNGNAPVDFAKAGERLLTASHELTIAMKGVHSLIHGRNYQTYQDHAQDHLDDDKCKFIDHMIAVQALGEYAYEVVCAGASIDAKNELDELPVPNEQEN